MGRSKVGEVGKEYVGHVDHLYTDSVEVVLESWKEIFNSEGFCPFRIWNPRK